MLGHIYSERTDYWFYAFALNEVMVIKTKYTV